jgi:hypothetical protein
VLSAVHLNNWIFVYPESRQNVVENFLYMATMTGKTLGINLAEPTQIALRQDHSDDYYYNIKKAITKQVSFN